MKMYTNRLNELTPSDVWVFTKQSTNFDEAFKSVRLLVDFIKRESSLNIEDFFSEYHSNYGISTNRHRILIIAQLFGLLTKTPFFSRSSRYENERPTAVFDSLNCYEIGSAEYNTIKSEQLLKVLIKPIIDTTDDGNDQMILPLIFSYLVLKKLKTLYNIDKITEDQYVTYIMTCKKFEEIDTISMILSESPPPSPLVGEFRDRSRIIPLIKINCNLIKFEKGFVFINPDFDNYFQDFLDSNLYINRLSTYINDRNLYAYFLYNLKNFNVNLIDKPTISYISYEDKSLISPMLESPESSYSDESTYIDQVDEIKEENINPDIAINAHKNELVIISTSKGERVCKNPIYGKIAIKQSDYLCDSNSSHETFESNRTKKSYMEAHHLVPVKFARKVYDEYKINVDCVENLVSLCPNCHRAIHHGTNETKENLIKILFKNKETKFSEIGFNISLDELIEMYK